MVKFFYDVIILPYTQEGEFPGLMPLLEEYLNDNDDYDEKTSQKIGEYLSFLKKRASGLWSFVDLVSKIIHMP